MPAILIGKDLLKALRIDPRDMLTIKLWEGLISHELEVSSIFSESGMKSTSFDQGQDQHTIITQGGYSHTLVQSSDRDSDDDD